MNNFLLAITVLAAAGSLALIGLMPTEGGPALMLALPVAAGVGLVISKIKEDEAFLLRLFVAAIMVRIFVGSAIYYFNQMAFFGGDVNTFVIFVYVILTSMNSDTLLLYIIIM